MVRVCSLGTTHHRKSPQMQFTIQSGPGKRSQLSKSITKAYCRTSNLKLF